MQFFSYTCIHKIYDKCSAYFSDCEMCGSICGKLPLVRLGVVQLIKHSVGSAICLAVSVAWKTKQSDMCKMTLQKGHVIVPAMVCLSEYSEDWSLKGTASDA